MKIISILLLTILTLVPEFSNGQDSSRDSCKKVMDHTIYDDWKSISNIRISNDGKWVTYEVNPNRGDGILHLINLEDNDEKIFERGSGARFSPESDYLVYRIKPPYQLVRKAKLDKKSSDKMPKDSLGIYRLQQDLLSKVPRVESFSVPDRASSWFVFKHHYKKDTTTADTSKKGLKPAEPEGKPAKLVVMNPVSMDKHEYEKVYDYKISEEGSAVAFYSFAAIDDTVAGKSVRYLKTGKRKAKEIFTSEGTFGKFTMDRSGSQLAFLHHQDSVAETGMNLHYFSDRGKYEGILLDTLSEGMPKGWGISPHGNLRFSGDGTRLFFGTAPLPEPEAEDTLLEDEKYQVDIWNWKDALLQPMQKKQVSREKNRNYTALWHAGSGRMVQLADKEMGSLRTLFRDNGDVALGSDNRPYEKLISWKTHRYRDYYLVDTRTGTRKLILQKKAFGVSLSPGGKYVTWYESADSNYYSHSIESGSVTCLTCEIEADFHNVEYDEPSDPNPYGITGFTEGDRDVLLYSQYDIWKIDPAGNRPAVNLTGGAGESSKTTFRYRHLEYDDPFIPPEKPIFLTGFNQETKESGIYSAHVISANEPVSLASGTNSYELVSRAREADVLCWRKGDFDEYTDIYISDAEFREVQRISDANPQAGEYYWGDPQLVRWTSYSGEELDGILITPEDFDPSKKYPMLVYFYEKRSDRLYRHSAPSPSRSTINLAWCASNGYVVFVPDITYRDGYPGQSAYDAVVSGSLAMCERFPFIDRENMGIQGQSWGGYQVAWLLTRTNIFKAGMAGAPVSNMTSAYGGIRWGSGASRMMQYEEGQSRIGGTLWEKTGLYLENSPLFRVPDIETPLLIMHNDNDGAVPWYQGIELFVALRRLEKPAWMLTYNNELHNLSKWPNRVDLSKRMMQFFDHFLKGAPAPEWMTVGIPATDKGKKDGYGVAPNDEK